MGRNGLFKDMTGQRCQRLLVVSRAPNRNGQAWWNCICDCGKSLEIFGRSLRDGGAKSCGCFSRDRAKTLSKTHGMSHRSEYKIWQGMIKRCANPNEPAYVNYGGRGISVCQRWMSFENFIADMGPKPEALTLERINNNGNYEPSNCKWAGRTEQARNSRHNRILSCNGKSQCISAWTEEMGHSRNLIGRRINNYGWPVDRAINEPSRRVSL